jgi:RNA polymerase sigma-70 factor (ECF subfamily)
MTKEQEFISIITKNKGIIYKVCNSYCKRKEDRDDLAQDIIFNLWKSFDSYKEQYKFSTWMYRVSLNVAISYYRQVNKIQFREYLPAGMIVFEETSDMKKEQDKNLSLLENFINDLNETDKPIILLYLDDKSHKEIAEITGYTETNVATRISRIKEKLRSNFKNNYKE